MNRWALLLPAGIALGTASAGAACSAGHPPQIGDECATTTNCDGGLAVRDAPDLPPLDDHETYVGTKTTITGVIAYSEEPHFPFFPQSPILPQPAALHFPFARFDYTGRYDPTAVDGGPGFTLTVPSTSNSTFVMVADIDGKNGIMNTIQQVDSIAGSSGWLVPAIRRAALETIYASVSPPVVMDPTKAQVVVTVLSASSVAVADVVVSPGISVGALIYDTPSGYVRGLGKTGPNGIAIFANMTAKPYPGGQYKLIFTPSGAQTNSEFGFNASADAVTLVGLRLAGVP